MNPEEKLESLQIVLPGLPAPLGSYVPCVRTGNLLFLSGMLPLREGRIARTGRVGETVSLADATDDARMAAVNALAVVKSALGTLQRVRRCVKVTGYVASGPDFFDQPKVMNGASDLLAAVFGDAGLHARAAVGVLVLPLNAPVEIDFVFEVGD